jgi:hypothetical protein
MTPGCARTINIKNWEEYRTDRIEVVTKDSTRYKLGAGWQVDSLNNLVGFGLKLEGTTEKKFHGNIAVSDIKRLSFRDYAVPAICIFVAISIWIKPHI